MPIGRQVFSVACSVLMLAACKPQPEPQANAAHPPETAEAATTEGSSAQPDLAAAAMTDTADDGKQILRINTNSGSVDCSDRHVEVLASQAELNFTGQCLELYFLGDNTRASIQSAQMVQVVANQVGISTSSPLAELRQLGNTGQHNLGEVTGEVYVQGDGNQIQAQSIGELRLTGSRNRIHWQRGQPETSDLGNANIIGVAK